MKFKYTLRNGTTIGIMDMIDIHSEYEALCTGELVQDFLTGGKMSDKIARTIGYEVRRRMDKCEYPDEQQTIDDVLNDVVDNVHGWLKTKTSSSIVLKCMERFDLDSKDDIAIFSVPTIDLFEWIYGDEEVKTEFENYFENEERIC